MYRSRSALITFAVILLVLIIAGYIAFRAHQKAVIEKVSDDHAFKALRNSDEHGFTSMSGEVVDLTNYFGKVLLVHSWASWCPSCAGELTKLSRIAEEYGQSEVVVLAVNRAEDRYTAERFLKSHQLEPKVELILDPSDSFFMSIGGYAMPETVVYGKNGDIVYHVRGDADPETIKNAVDSALAE